MRGQINATLLTRDAQIASSGGRYLYENDDRGNWIVRREEAFYEDAWVPVAGVTYREITYFK